MLVVGDGMSLSTVAAARVYSGQQSGRDGASARLTWEKFPHLGLARTYNVDSMVPDSAATAFSIYSGVKTNFFTMGFNNQIKVKEKIKMFICISIKFLRHYDDQTGGQWDSGGVEVMVDTWV